MSHGEYVLSRVTVQSPSMYIRLKFLKVRSPVGHVRACQTRASLTLDLRLRTSVCDVTGTLGKLSSQKYLHGLLVQCGLVENIGVLMARERRFIIQAFYIIVHRPFRIHV